MSGQARKALRALKALVKLQAHVRGYLMRRRAAETLQSMQALIRAQASVLMQKGRAPNEDRRFQPDIRPRNSMVTFILFVFSAEYILIIPVFFSPCHIKSHFIHIYVEI